MRVLQISVLPASAVRDKRGRDGGHVDDVVILKHDANVVYVVNPVDLLKLEHDVDTTVRGSMCILGTRRKRAIPQGAAC